MVNGSSIPNPTSGYFATSIVLTLLIKLYF